MRVQLEVNSQVADRGQPAAASSGGLYAEINVGKYPAGSTRIRELAAPIATAWPVGSIQRPCGPLGYFPRPAPRCRPIAPTAQTPAPQADRDGVRPRSRASSLPNKRRAWVFMVSSDRCSSRPIARFDRPRLIPRRIWTSRSVSPPRSPLNGRLGTPVGLGAAQDPPQAPRASISIPGRRGPRPRRACPRPVRSRTR